MLIRLPDQVLIHPEVARADDYREAIWQAQRIVDGICDSGWHVSRLTDRCVRHHP